MPIRNIDPSEGILVSSINVGPDTVEIDIRVNDWKRFIDVVKNVKPGRSVLFKEKLPKGHQVIYIKNTDEGIKTLEENENERHL